MKTITMDGADLKQTPTKFKTWSTKGHGDRKLFIRVDDRITYIFDDEDIAILKDQILNEQAPPVIREANEQVRL